MNVVILAGGFGTRISEESHLKPKPMIEIGGMPILWHIMKSYSAHGYNDFIIVPVISSILSRNFSITILFVHPTLPLISQTAQTDLRYTRRILKDGR